MDGFWRGGVGGGIFLRVGVGGGGFRLRGGQGALAGVEPGVLGFALNGVGVVEKNALDVLVVKEARAVNEFVEHPGWDGLGIFCGWRCWRGLAHNGRGMVAVCARRHVGSMVRMWRGGRKRVGTGGHGGEEVFFCGRKISFAARQIFFAGPWRHP